MFVENNSVSCVVIAAILPWPKLLLYLQAMALQEVQPTAGGLRREGDPTEEEEGQGELLLSVERRWSGACGHASADFPKKIKLNLIL